MDAIVMTVRDNKYDVSLAASLLLSRLVWLFKPDVLFAQTAKKLSKKFGGPKSNETIPLGRRKRIVKEYSERMAEAVETILVKGWWSPSIRHLKNPPTDGKKKWVTSRHYFKRLALFSYDWKSDTFRLPTPHDRVEKYPWWDMHTLREAENGKYSVVNSEEREYLAFVRNVYNILSARHEPDEGKSQVVAGSALFSVNEHTEFNPGWIKGQEKYRLDAVKLEVPVPRMALASPETATFLQFKSNGDVGPVLLNTDRVTPRMDWKIPADVEAFDPWVFYGEPLK